MVEMGIYKVPSRICVKIEEKNYTTFGVSRMLDSCCVDYTENEKLTY